MSRFQVFLRVILFHGLLLGLIVLLPLLKSCEWFPKKEQMITVDLASLPPLPPEQTTDPEEDEPEVTEEEAISEATPEPVPTPTATPLPAATATPQPAATPVPTATPRPQPTPTPKPRQVLLTPEQIRARIENQQQNTAPTVAAPTLSPAQIQAMISQGLPTGGGGMGTAVGPVNGGAGINMSGVDLELQRRLYSTWDQPVHLSSQSGLQAIATVNVQKSGNISSSRILRGSGNQEFDQSVNRALSAVKFAKALPADYTQATYTIEITFRLTR